MPKYSVSGHPTIVVPLLTSIALPQVDRTSSPVAADAAVPAGPRMVPGAGQGGTMRGLLNPPSGSPPASIGVPKLTFLSGASPMKTAYRVALGLLEKSHTKPVAILLAVIATPHMMHRIAHMDKLEITYKNESRNEAARANDLDYNELRKAINDRQDHPPSSAGSPVSAVSPGSAGSPVSPGSAGSPVSPGSAGSPVSPGSPVSAVSAVSTGAGTHLSVATPQSPALQAPVSPISPGLQDILRQTIGEWTPEWQAEMIGQAPAQWPEASGTINELLANSQVMRDFASSPDTPLNAEQEQQALLLGENIEAMLNASSSQDEHQ